jgi:SAM-dependent methyltransferase
VKPGPILAVPCVEKGRGGGHLVRSLVLVRDLRALGREAWLYLAGGGEGPDLVRLCEGFRPAWLVSEPQSPAAPWAFIVLDRFATPEAEFHRWAALAPLIGVDEGGPCRRHFDFLIDLLPGLNRRPCRRANVQDPSLIPLPKNRRPPGAGTEPGKPLRTLISFGAEDPAGLGPLVCKALAAQNAAGELDIDFIPGGLRQTPGGEGPGASVRTLPPVPHLGEYLAAYDLLITHFGLTAFEALYAGVPALLVSPGPYHEKLAKGAGFYSAGMGRRGARRAAALLFRRAGGRKTLNRAFLAKLGPEKTAARHGLDGPQKQSFAGLAASFFPQISPACPACGGPVRPAGAARFTGPFPRVLARFPRRTYRRCPRCGIVYLDRLDPPPIEYGRDYFFDFYKKQYGKTYIEDFPGLIAAGRGRLNRIQALMPGRPAGEKRLLDIGCAYGPFLLAAGEAGFSPLGIDPAEDAAAYVRETLKLEARQGAFPDISLETESFDVITLWYVIEHFQDPRRALAEIRRLLKPGGVLAFSTPSLDGVSGRKNRRAFLEKSPEDHRTVWSPQTCGRILKIAGFRVRRIHVTGHHPERFSLLGRFAGSGGPVSALLLGLSRIFRLGDTFEVYAQKDMP